MAVTGAYQKELHDELAPGTPITPDAGDLSDIFVMALDDGGKYLWARGFVDGADDRYPQGWAVAFDPAGDVLVTGRMSGTIDCSGTVKLTSTGGYDAFLIKLNKEDGSLEFCQRFGGPQGTDQAGTGISVDAGGNIYVAGTFSESIDFDSKTTLAGSTGQNIFVAKLSSKGEPIWTKRYGQDEPAGQRWIRLAGDLDGKILLAGGWETELDFGVPGGPLKPAAGAGIDLFVANLSE